MFYIKLYQKHGDMCLAYEIEMHNYKLIEKYKISKILHDYLITSYKRRSKIFEFTKLVVLLQLNEQSYG